ncbi:hypothetical protein HNP84_010282 [Thermocatellispora tengchongensis]|uniref:Uncharacterized protein n=1 Tax=Thermocatellispora tengchongensis TaxID=1073253 RepID=A0A840PGH7_9ACTN|nr:hypothetical protein [Thermocatellispora tengchongensis]MBB5140514.1 hypothetical protein [Thermocatellispora tengchongensis]
MSRYTIPNAPGAPESCITAVGWDAPCNTYWATAFDPHASGGEERGTVFSIGDTPCELPDVESLVTALREHGVELPPSIVDVLRTDKPGEGFAGEVTK